MNKRFKKIVYLIRKSIKQELDRHDWCYRKTPSGNLKRVVARKILNSLKTNNINEIKRACQEWDYLKKFVWKEPVNWEFYYFIIESSKGILATFSKMAEDDIIKSAMKQALIDYEDANIFGDQQT